MPSPKPKPTRLKIIDGDKHTERINKNEPQPRDGATCPAWLSKDAKAEWKRITPELKALGLLTILDRTTLAAYCQAYANWKEAELLIQEMGTQYTVRDSQGQRVVKRYPHTAAAQEWNKRMQSLAAEFGFSPSSRTKISLTGEDINEAESFLFGSK
jgi:P27 family predicted phage terminase small subunit